MPEQTLQSVAFPTLDAAQIHEFERGTKATPRSYRDGQTLISVGDRDFKFFIVKSGEVEIVDHSGDAPKTVVVHGQGQFTGDVSHLTGRAAVIGAVARGEYPFPGPAGHPGVPCRRARSICQSSSTRSCQRRCEARNT